MESRDFAVLIVVVVLALVIFALARQITLLNHDIAWFGDAVSLNAERVGALESALSSVGIPQG